MFQAKRIYHPRAAEDGHRILTDRLWPRGMTKEAAQIDLWLKEVAPSNELRKWFHRDMTQWQGFVARYREELKAPERVAALETLRRAGREHATVTLLYSGREEAHNHAALLCEMLNGEM